MDDRMRRGPESLSGPAHLLDAVAADGIPANTDLWPHLAPRVAGARARGRRMVARLAAVAAAALLAAVVLAPSVVGSAAAAVQESLQAAGLVLVQRWPPPTPTARPSWTPAPAQPVAVERVQAVRTGGQTLAEVQAQVGFPVCAPTWLPPGVALIGGTAFPPDFAIVVFRPTDGRELAGGGIQQTRGRRQGGVVVPAEHAKEVRVNGQPAYYARGAFDKQSTWHPEYDSAILSWEANGVTYVLQYSGLGLSEQDLVRTAESCAPVGGAAPTQARG